jgi:nicotinate phosphoribosyltransferase
VDGVPVHKRSVDKTSAGGRKQALRMSRPSGTIVEEVVYPDGRPPADSGRVLTVPLVRGGDVVTDTGATALAAARDRVASGLHSLPWEGLKLAHGEPAIPTRLILQ